MLKKIMASATLFLALGTIAAAQAIENASRSTIGYVNPDGSVENSSRGTIGYFKDVDPKHVAAFFFFNRKD